MSLLLLKEKGVKSFDKFHFLERPSDVALSEVNFFGCFFSIFI